MMDFRPLSMLNIDFKILSRALATRLLPHMQRLVHADQNSFIPSRSTSNNLRLLYNVMFHKDLSNYPEAVVMSIDLEKAFDSLSWGFLLATMERMQMGEGWLNWVHLLYEEPRARVRTGTTVSPSYNMCRGTRQGCPLSPLLFALAMEPLAERIRREGGRLGIKLDESTHIISLYADDVLLYLRNGAVGIQEMLRILEEFEELSGLRLNRRKTHIFPMHPSLLRPLTLPLDLDWAPVTFRYLGVRIYHTQADLMEGNLGGYYGDFRRLWPFGVC